MIARIMAVLLGAAAMLFFGAGAPSAFAEELEAGQTAIVTGTEGRGMRVRSGPGMSYSVLTTANEGTKVTVVAGPIEIDSDMWYQVNVGSSKTGWSNSRYLTSSVSVQAMSNTEGQRTFIAKMTAYADGVGGVPMGARTYSGTRTRWGVVAVDPKVVPIGSLLTIDGYEGTTFVAEDIGGGIKGESIDIWLPDPKEARAYGTQYRRVTIIREGPAR